MTGYKKKIRKKNAFAPKNLYYDKEEDCSICPSGEPMYKQETFLKKSSTGFKQNITAYQAKSCSGCPIREGCHKAAGDRIILINHNLNRLKEKADALLLSKRGIKNRKRRLCDVESVFGNIKNNHHFRRFMLRGIEEVNVETGLLALAHNLRKKSA